MDREHAFIMLHIIKFVLHHLYVDSMDEIGDASQYFFHLADMHTFSESDNWNYFH